MTYGYALQILAVFAIMSVVALTTVWIATRRFDHNTEEAKRQHAANRERVANS